MERSTKGETVNEKRGYSSAGPAETRVKSRAATPNTRSFRSSLKGSMKGILKGKPSSLVFAAADSESDSDHRARHHCSFSSRGGASPEIMDLRLLDSEHGRRSSYELSVCSAGSIESMQTNDEKMRVIEVTLPASLKKEGDEEKSMGLLDALKARRRFSMETIWSTHKKAVPKGTSVASSLGDPIVEEKSSITKNPRKVRARRCAQATVILVVLAMIVVLPWLVITFYLGMGDASLVSSITAKIPGMLEGLFDPRDDEEVHHEQAGKPPLVPARNTENRLLMRERIPRDRQTRIKADEERLGKVQSRRERRI